MSLATEVCLNPCRGHHLISLTHSNSMHMVTPAYVPGILVPVDATKPSQSGHSRHLPHKVLNFSPPLSLALLSSSHVFQTFTLMLLPFPSPNMVSSC